MTSRSGTQLRIIDASAVVELLLVSERADAVSRVIRNVRLMAPDLINPEVLHAIRKRERTGEISGSRAEQMIGDFVDMPLTRMSTLGLLRDVWMLRANLSAYDACYVALANELDAELITCDERLARAPNLGIPLIVV